MKMEATRVNALCIYTAVMACGAVMGRILYGKVGVSYAPALAFMSGSAVKSATGPPVQDPKRSDEVAAVAIYRVLKEELPNIITGMTVKEVLDMATKLRKVQYNEEEYIAPYRHSTMDEARARGISDVVFVGAFEGWGRYVNHLSFTN